MYAWTHHTSYIIHVYMYIFDSACANSQSFCSCSHPKWVMKSKPHAAMHKNACIRFLAVYAVHVMYRTKFCTITWNRNESKRWEETWFSKLDHAAAELWLAHRNACSDTCNYTVFILVHGTVHLHDYWSVLHVHVLIKITQTHSLGLLARRKLQQSVRV